MTSTYVKVLEAELLEAVVESGLDDLGVVLRVPKLGGDEDILTLQTGDLGERLLESFADLGLVSVNLGEIQVAVSNLEGLVDTLADLTRRGLPCAVTQKRDLGTSVESKGLSLGHVDSGF
jgi:hypothetical protein